MLRQSERRYRSLFENCPVALWEEDFSVVKRHIDELRARGVQDFRSWFAAHPEEIACCSRLVKIIDVNQAALRLFEAGNKEDLLSGLEQVRGESYAQFTEQMIAIAEGRTRVEIEAVSRTLSGRAIHFALRWSAISGCEDSLTRVIVSMEDVTEHRRAEKELGLLAATLRSVSECVSITDMSDNICFVNEAFLRTYGYENQELIGRNIAIVRSPNNPPQVVREILPATLRGGWRGELLNSRRDGTEFRIYLSTSVVRDEWRQSIFLVGIATDLTESKRVEEEIYRSRQMLQLILDNIPQRVFWKDRNCCYLGCNKAFAADTGLSHPREIIGKSDFDLVGGVNAEQYRRDDRHVMETGLPKLSFEESQFRLGGGEPSWLRTSKVPLHNRQGQVIGVLGTYEDITEQKRAEQALRASEEKYRQFFDEDLSGVYHSTPDGRLLACNPTFLRIFGFDSLEEAMNSDMSLFYPSPQDRQAFLQELREHRKLERRETEGRRKDGKPVYLFENAFGLFNDKGELEEIKGYLFDNTSHKKLEEQFRQSQKMEAVGRLAGGIAHDFNNLLTCINGYSELLTLKLDKSDQSRSFAEEIYAAGVRAAKLTRQLLAFSRRQVLQPEILDLNSIVQGMEHMLRRLIGEDIDLCVVPGRNLALVETDPGQIEQVIMNLVVNARDAMPHGGHLVIQTAGVDRDESFVQEHSGAKAGKYVMLSVRDNGCGMNAEVRSHLFEPFFTTKELGKGTGLGLCTVYGIVKQSDGFVAVDTEEGVGTTFGVYLPRVEGQPEQAAGKQQVSESTHGSESILLVEDEPSVLEFEQNLLLRKGYHVISVPDGPSALEICGRDAIPIDLLITDVVMPKMGGRELARSVVARRPEIRVLFVSGYSEDAILNQGLLEPDTAFLQKPFTADALPRKVREVLDSKGTT